MAAAWGWVGQLLSPAVRGGSLHLLVVWLAHLGLILLVPGWRCAPRAQAVDGRSAVASVFVIARRSCLVSMFVQRGAKHAIFSFVDDAWLHFALDKQRE